MTLGKDVKEKIMALLTAAFGLVAALAQNDAIQSAFKQYFGESGGLYAKFFYAIMVTVIAVIIMVQLNKIKKEICFFKLTKL